MDGDAASFTAAIDSTQEESGKKQNGLMKTVKSKSPVILIAGCFLLTIVAAVIIATVARKKRSKNKSSVVSDVINMDLEMQNPPEAGK